MYLFFVILEGNSCYWEANWFWTHAATVEKQKEFTGKATAIPAAVEYFIMRIYRVMIENPIRSYTFLTSEHFIIMQWYLKSMFYNVMIRESHSNLFCTHSQPILTPSPYQLSLSSSPSHPIMFPYLYPISEFLLHISANNSYSKFSTRYFSFNTVTRTRKSTKPVRSEWWGQWGALVFVTKYKWLHTGHTRPIISGFIKSRMVYLSGTDLPKLSWKEATKWVSFVYMLFVIARWRSAKQSQTKFTRSWNSWKHTQNASMRKRPYVGENNW